MDEYYKILNIEYDYSIENIKKAYRKLSLKYHPDKNNNNSEYFNKINHAYNYIINNLNNNNTNNNNNNNTNTNTNTNTNSLLPINNYENITSNNNIQYCYENLMHSNREDIIKELYISYQESYNGSIKPLNIQRQLLNNNIIKYENETIYINIPQGIDNEELILVNNKGNVFNGNYSNVKIIIKLLKHQDFNREGLDIYYNTYISFKESLIGFNFILKHLNNKNYKIENKINTIVHNNSKIILKNLGFIRDGFIGNLYVTFNINYPKLLDSDTIQKLKEIL
jgi:DnaJ-class molecular chaperone